MDSKSNKIGWAIHYPPLSPPPSPQRPSTNFILCLDSKISHLIFLQRQSFQYFPSKVVFRSLPWVDV
jgi:hypothetical protein